MKSLLLFLALAGALVAAEPGQPEPAWQLTTLDGKVLSNTSLKGKVVILDFWAPWCSPCRKEIPGYQALLRKYGGDGLVIVGIGTDCDKGSVEHFLAQHPDVTYDMAMSTNPVYQAFDYPDALPTTFLIDRNGIVRDRKVGGESAAAYEKKVLACLHPGGA